jgi:hypothetical protein
VEALLQGCGADMAAWWYVKRMRRLNLTGKQQGGSASVADGLSGFGGAAQSQLTNLLGTTFGQGLSSLTKGELSRRPPTRSTQPAAPPAALPARWWRRAQLPPPAGTLPPQE